MNLRWATFIAVLDHMQLMGRRLGTPDLKQADEVLMCIQKVWWKDIHMEYRFWLIFWECRFSDILTNPLNPVSPLNDWFIRRCGEWFILFKVSIIPKFRIIAVKRYCTTLWRYPFLKCTSNLRIKEENKWRWIIDLVYLSFWRRAFWPTYNTVWWAKSCGHVEYFGGEVFNLLTLLIWVCY